MSQLVREQMEALAAAINAEDCLRRVRAEVEGLHRVVFHAAEQVDWNRVRRSAEQILTAEIVYRHQGRADGVYFALRALEDGGRTWDAAVRELAATIHSYYTTPLGVVMRQDLFGPEAAFIVPDAHDWPSRLKEGAGGSGRMKP